MKPVNISFLRTQNINSIYLAKVFGNLIKKNTHSQIIELLRIMEPKINDIDIILIGDKMPALHVDIGKKEKIPINFLGDGFIRFLSILTLMATTQNGIVLIDEIENGLHHSIISKIWEGIGNASEKYNCQILATTHSYECIKGAFEGLTNLKNFRFIRLDQNNENIQAVIFNKNNLQTAFKHKMEIR